MKPAPTFLILLASVAWLHAAESEGELSRQATDPTASLMALNFQSIYVAGFHGAAIPGEADDARIFQFRPVIPFKFLGHLTFTALFPTF